MNQRQQTLILTAFQNKNFLKNAQVRVPAVPAPHGCRKSFHSLMYSFLGSVIRPLHPTPAGFRVKGRQSLGVLLFAARLALVAAAIFLRFSPTAFSLSSRLSVLAFSFLFFLAEGAIRLEVYLLANPATTAAAVFLPGAPFFAFSRAVFADITRAAFTGNQAEINLTLIHIDRFDAHFHAVARAVSLAAGLADQPLPDPVEAIVVIIQRGDMYQTIDKQIVQADEEAKSR